MRIIDYEERYRDDMIFMVLEAKNALGRVPSINPDLLGIRANYIDKGDCFLLALDDDDRVIGCGGYSSIEGTAEVRLHRLYVKCSRKHCGIGSALLAEIERRAREHGKNAASVHLGQPREQWFESWSFYPKHGYAEYAPGYMRREL